MSWPGSATSCPGSRSTRTTASKTDEGSAGLADLFRGRSQLLIYHFMFGPDYTAVASARCGTDTATYLREGRA